MADILIRGMEMPKGDEAKLIAIWPSGDVSSIFLYNENRDLGFALPSKTPVIAIALPEGHGRLVDADEVMLKVKTHDYPLATMKGSRDYGMFTPGFQQAVNETTTIVPAEKERNQQ